MSFMATGRREMSTQLIFHSYDYNSYDEYTFYKGKWVYRRTVDSIQICLM